MPEELRLVGMILGTIALVVFVPQLLPLLRWRTGSTEKRRLILFSVASYVVFLVSLWFLTWKQLLSFAHATEQGGPIPDAGFWVSIQLPVPIGVLSCALGLYAYAKSFEGAKRRLLNALAITALSIGVVWFLVAATITILAFSF